MTLHRSLIALFLSGFLGAGCRTQDVETSTKDIAVTDSANAYLFYTEGATASRVCVVRCSRSDFESIAAELTAHSISTKDALSKLKNECVRYGSVPMATFKNSVANNFMKASTDGSRLYKVGASNSSFQSISDKIDQSDAARCAFSDDADDIVVVGDGGGSSSGGGGNPPPSGGGSNPCTPTQMLCDQACSGSGQKTCKTLDCRGNVVSTTQQACTPAICEPTNTKCDSICPESGSKHCRVFDCHGLVVSQYDEACTPTPPTYSCSKCVKVTDSCDYTMQGSGVYPTTLRHDGVIYCYNAIKKTASGQTTREEQVCTKCDFDALFTTPCDNLKEADFRCRQ